MATVFDSLSLKGLRLAHLRQLLAYVESRENDMWYYGDRISFENRHDDIKDWLISAIEYAKQNDVRFPK